MTYISLILFENDGEKTDNDLYFYVNLLLSLLAKPEFFKTFYQIAKARISLFRELFNIVSSRSDIVIAPC